MQVQQVDRFDGVSRQLHAASAVSACLLSELILAAAERLPAADRAAATARVRRLIESGAWTDAALALVEAGLPGWQLRRLVFEDGQWLCSLSRQAHLPVGLDDCVEATHEVLPLAILGALLEARRGVTAAANGIAAARQAPATPSRSDCAFAAIPCDNFS